MKTCIFYGNCQVIYNVYDVLNSIPEFRDQYKSIRYVNHDRDQTRELSNINIEVEDIVPYIIINDPENFINSPYA